MVSVLDLLSATRMLGSGPGDTLTRPEGLPCLPIYDAAMPFCTGVAQVESFRLLGVDSSICRAQRYEGKHGIVDHSGKYIWQDSKDQIWKSPFCY
jgi:hypothetical protein